MKEFLKRLAGQATLLVSAVTVVEIWQGARPAEFNHTRALFEALTVIPLDEKLAARAGQLAGELRRSGLIIALADAVIAATALQAEAPVLTTNPKHFQPVPGLEVRDLREELIA